MKSFTELRLAPELNSALKEMNFTQPTEIQARAIPVAMMGKDLIASAQTGTGKTAAFALPVIARVLHDLANAGPGFDEQSVKAVILVPTRELGQQVASVIKQLIKNAPALNVAQLIGGAPMS